MNVPRGGRQLFASLDSARQSYANLARIWNASPQPARHLRPVA